jgi:hypothetical protein
MRFALVSSAFVVASLVLGGCGAVVDDGSQGSSALAGGEKEGAAKPPSAGEKPPSDCEKPPTDPGEKPPMDPICKDTVISVKGCEDVAKVEAIAKETCGGGVLAAFSPINESCPAGTASGAKLSCCPVTEPPPPPPKCEEDLVGPFKACVDPATIKEAAWKICSAKGASLADIVLDAACGESGSTSAKIRCCAETVDPLPPPPPPKCEYGAVEGLGCIDPALLKEKLAGLCASKGLALTEFWPNAACGAKGASAAKYACCAADVPEPPPPPPVCERSAISGGEGCVDPGLLKEKAASACAKAGLVLAEFYPDEACGAKGSSAAKYACCAADALPEPVPGK